jgi:hypothetical protein
VLAEPDDPAHVAPFAHILAGIAGVLPCVADAYRSGGGVPYQAHGRAFRHGQGHINTPAFTNELAAGWPASMPDVVERLKDGRTRVADLGCGQGWSSLASRTTSSASTGCTPLLDRAAVDLDVEASITRCAEVTF